MREEDLLPEYELIKLMHENVSAVDAVLEAQVRLWMAKWGEERAQIAMKCVMMAKIAVDLSKK
jgi:hypothetical protein